MGTLNLPPHIERELEDVPMLSEVATRLLTLTADDDHAINEVARLIESDVYLAANVLKLANSAAFSRGHAIESVHRAVMHLGEGMVVSLALAMSTGELFHRPLVGYARPEGALWAFSLQEAIAAREISRFAIRPVRPDLAYTAGLLFNIGMAVLSDHLRQHEEELARHLDREPNQDFLDVEQDLTGTNRDVIGARLAMRWKLPESIVTALAYGHRPSEAPEEHKSLVYSVHVGDILSRSIGFGAGVDALDYTVDPEYRSYLNLRRSQLEKAFMDVVQEFNKIEAYVLAE